ncbi:MAG: FAD/NAD(P)-binding protein [Proteobacteria bacterium]|nr:FAD/NAD(P)-binding protein [Pseudomonadota bacterium]MBU1716049.1 FAD/NAD(P)-binding protein [Pseudomonadota bacterium]
MKTLQPEDYLPRPAIIKEIITENSQIKTFVLSFANPEQNTDFSYQPGQFMMVSIPHCGEAPISFSSTPARKEMIRLSVRKAGKLTSALHELQAGAIIGLRGPYGKPFPMDYLAKRDLLFVAGGIGLAPLCSVINSCLFNPDYHGRISILYGSRTPEDIAFMGEINFWRQNPDVKCLLTVDQGTSDWHGATGVVTTLFSQTEINPEQQTAIICGPPMMIKAVISELNEMGFGDDDIITTMERHMKCGVGVCRHCHMDGKLVCVDGPVFSLRQLKELDVMEIK